jgi:uncharacterized protein
MPRRRQLRKIVEPPKFHGFMPYGMYRHTDSSIDLLYEEYEAVKLADYDLLSHQEACKHMGVSRPTFARIYESARRKIAKAFVEAMEIRTSFGNVYFEDSWFICRECEARFTLPEVLMENNCPMCRTTNIESMNSNGGKRH